jgi:hypothetical protein
MATTTGPAKITQAKASLSMTHGFGFITFARSVYAEVP